MAMRYKPKYYRDMRLTGSAGCNLRHDNGEWAHRFIRCDHLFRPNIMNILRLFTYVSDVPFHLFTRLTSRKFALESQIDAQLVNANACLNF
jgi:hypothetical protein